MEKPFAPALENRRKVLRSRRCLRLAGLLFLVFVWGPRLAWSQTPSPLQEWQYPGGISLAKLFEPDQPEWRDTLGVAVTTRPLYDGARVYRALTGPVIDIRYRDLAFASVGEGLGVNVVRGPNYRAGIALGYDLGRSVSDYFDRLHGLGDINPAPVIKLFASYAVSQQFPIVLRADVRQFVGGADGVIGDFSAFLPLPGSSEHFFMLGGPSITLADRLYMRREFGVSAVQAADSVYPSYAAHGGDEAAGFGFSSTWLITRHWMLNADAAVNWLLGSARQSPITQNTTQGALAIAAAYTW